MMLPRFLNFLKLRKQNTSSFISNELFKILGFTPKNPDLFIQVFTPRCIQKKNIYGMSINYERLEFLGDSMLGAVISEYLYDKAPEEKEGYLTQMRSKIVSRKHLNEIGKDLKLLNFIDKNIKENFSLSQHVEGDIFEALIGAIYKDQGFEVTKKFIHNVVIERYVEIEKLEKRISSYKSHIFEWAQKNKKNIEFYTHEEVNAEDTTIFVSKIKLDGKITAKGRGTSKKKAEEIAAKRVYYSKQNRM